MRGWPLTGLTLVALLALLGGSSPAVADGAQADAEIHANAAAGLDPGDILEPHERRLCVPAGPLGCIPLPI